MRTRLPARLLLVGLALTAAAGCGSSSGGGTSRIAPAAGASAGGNALPTSGGKGPLAIASANFPENQILAEVYRQALARAGYQATVKSLTTRPVILKALASDDVQVEPDYVGSMAQYLNKAKTGTEDLGVPTSDLTAVTAKARELGTEKGLTVLTPSPAADQNAFAVTKAFSQKNGVTKLSDLAGYKGPLVLGGTPECKTYGQCQPGLERVYGLRFTGFEQTDLGGTLSVTKLKSGKVQLGEFLSSDGGVKANDFVVLEDDKKLQSVDNVVPVLSGKAAADLLVKTVLEKVSAAMSTQDLIDLNASVSIDRKLPAQAATDFLKAKGLLG
ncbi:MAG: opuC [Frankiales bacterium]|nr:opuC [Frankiales bacterium]